MSNPIKQPDPHLAFVLYGSLINSGRYSLPAVARRSGLSYELLSKLCRGERHVLAEHVPAIYRGTHDLDLYAQLTGARECDLVVTTRSETTGSFAVPEAAALKLGGAVGTLQTLLAEALADGRLSDDERRKLADAATVVERHAAKLLRVVAPRTGTDE